MRRPITLRDFLLRYPSSSLSPAEKEALRHEREIEAQERLDLHCLEMAVTDGSDEPNVPEQDTAPTETKAEETVVQAP